MREPIRQLVELGPLPTDSAVVTQGELDRYVEVLDSIGMEAPLTDEEARALVPLFPPDGSVSFGLAWSLLHLIETAPGWPLEDCLIGEDEWRRILRLRVENARRGS